MRKRQRRGVFRRQVQRTRGCPKVAVLAALLLALLPAVTGQSVEHPRPPHEGGADRVAVPSGIRTAVEPRPAVVGPEASGVPMPEGPHDRAARELCDLLVGSGQAAPTLLAVDPPRSSAEQALLASLQGLANRDAARLWIRSGGMQAVILAQLEREGQQVEQLVSVWEALERLRGRVRGGVLYAEADGSINAATSLAGVLDGVLVEEGLAERVAGLGVPVLADARGLDAAGIWRQFAGAWGRHLVCEQAPQKVLHLRDVAVALRMFTFWEVASPERTDYVRQQGPGVWAFGWGSSEHRWIEDVSRGGGVGVPSDWSMNLSALRHLRVELPERPLAVAAPREDSSRAGRAAAGTGTSALRPPLPPGIAPARSGERIVAFVMSDGDNIQFLGGQFVDLPGFWASRHRGSFDMTWETAPVLALIAPRVLGHLYSTAHGGAATDDFIAGPSGAGYHFPHALPERAGVAAWTAESLRRSQLRITTVLNYDGTMDECRELLERPEIDAVIYKDYAPYHKQRGAIRWHAGKPCVAYRYVLWEPRPDRSPAGVAAQIARLPADPTRHDSSYALVNVHAWSFGAMGGPMEAIRQTIGLLPEGTRVVTASELIALLRAYRTPEE